MAKRWNSRKKIDFTENEEIRCFLFLFLFYYFMFDKKLFIYFLQFFFISSYFYNTYFDVFFLYKLEKKRKEKHS